MTGVEGPEDSRVPRVPGFGTVALLAAAAVTVVAINGVQHTWDADPVRLAVTALVLAALGTSAVVPIRAGLWGMRDSDRIDERDRAIVSAAGAGQAGAILLTLAVWMIALVETFHDTGLVPSAFLYAIFWSSLLVSQLAWLAGVMLGYRRS